MTEDMEQHRCLSMTTQPVRQPPRVAHEGLWEAAVDGLPVEDIAQEVSITGFPVLFFDFSPDHLSGALLQTKFVTLKRMTVGIIHRGSDILVRFRVEHIQEG